MQHKDNMAPKSSSRRSKPNTPEPDMSKDNNTISEVAHRRSKRKAAEQEADAATKKPKVAIHTTQVDIASSKGKPAQHQTHRNVQLEIPLSSITSSNTKSTGKRIVFNDDDDNNDNDDDDGDDFVSPDGANEFFTPQGSPTTAMTTTMSAQQPKAGDGEDEEDESDSDDDAPEAVSTHTAAAQAAKSAQAAAHAAGKQRDAERQRRQERDARLKAQAGLRRKQQPKQQAERDSDSDSEAEEEEEEEEEEKKAATQAARAGSKPKRFTKNNLPDLLPEELLASDSESEDEEDEEIQEKRRSTIIKFNTVARQVAKAESRQPADQRVGSTVYRVMHKKTDERLAPKGSKFSRNARDGLLARGRPGPKSRTISATTKGGFLVKR